jgi:TetR/AcrR family transcriptional repressor of nem operon
MTDMTRGQKTKQDIIQAGTRLFALHGYFHTSTNDILEAVSVSKGAFYHHFKSKEELALAVLDQLHQDYQQQVFDNIPNDTPPSQRLWDTLNRLVQLNASGQWANCLLLARLTQEMAEQDSQLAQRVAHIVNWIIASWESLIAEAQTARAVRSDLNPTTFAQLIVTTLFGAVSCRELSGNTIQLQDLFRQLQIMAPPHPTEK